MDDTTRGLAGDGDDMTGRADEMTRNLEATASTPRSTRVPPARATSSPRGAKAVAPRQASAASDLDPETEAKTRQIQAEIADTRVDLSETIDALQEKLRPSTIVSDATDRVKTATTEKVRHMAETASDTAQEVIRSTRQATSGLVEGARQNPIPALMIGAGVAWLLMEHGRHHASDRGYARDRGLGARPRVGPIDEDAVYGYGEYGSGYTDEPDRGGYGEGVRRMGERAADIAGSARSTLRRSTRGAQNGIQRLLRDNPLLVGAAAIVAGAAVGAALPETDRENELMGETRDSVVDRAQDMARNAASTVQEVAGEAVKTVTDRVAPGSDPLR
jgi:ElaB/YqjD/DUF883 family membrane-anchored ribosome-binding protein